MKVRLLCFASVADLLGGREQEVEVAEGATVSDLLDRIGSEHPKFREIRRSLVVSVNQEYVERGQALREQDEVALIPPVSGGTGSGDPGLPCSHGSARARRSRQREGRTTA